MFCIDLVTGPGRRGPATRRSLMFRRRACSTPLFPARTTPFRSRSTTRPGPQTRRERGSCSSRYKDVPASSLAGPSRRSGRAEAVLA